MSHKCEGGEGSRGHSQWEQLCNSRDMEPKWTLDITPYLTYGLQPPVAPQDYGNLQAIAIKGSLLENYLFTESHDWNSSVIDTTLLFMMSLLILTLKNVMYQLYSDKHPPWARICKPFYSPGIDSQPGGPVHNHIWRTGLPGYIGWQNRFLGNDSWTP